MKNFKVGGRVVYNYSKKGTIVFIADGCAKVNFDDDVGGFEFKELGVPDGHGWNIPFNDLDLVNNKLGVRSKRVD